MMAKRHRDGPPAFNPYAWFPRAFQGGKMAIRKMLFASTAVTLLGAAGLAVSATGASAYVACNREGGDCWHTDKRVSAPGARFDYHPDDWYFHQKWDADKDHHFRDYHDGRGYYKSGIWIQL
jgi:hypothetical protein